MEPSKDKSQANPPGHSLPGAPPRPIPQPERRAVFNDFAPRPHASPLPPQPSQASVPQVLLEDRHSSSPSPQRPLTTEPVVTSESSELPPQQATELETPPKNATAIKSHHKTGHAGLVGFGTFIAVTALFLSPVLPGKSLQNMPGSWQSSANGDQNIACAGTPTDSQVTITQTRRLGFPVVWSSTTITALRADCAGTVQSATVGHDSETNPLGIAIDVFSSLVIALVVKAVWRALFGRKR